MKSIWDQDHNSNCYQPSIAIFLLIKKRYNTSYYGTPVITRFWGRDLSRYCAQLWLKNIKFSSLKCHASGLVYSPASQIFIVLPFTQTSRIKSAHRVQKHQSSICEFLDITKLWEMRDINVNCLWCQCKKR